MNLKKARSGSVGHSCLLSIQTKPRPYRQTSIICTIGPVSRDMQTLQEVFDLFGHFEPFFSLLPLEWKSLGSTFRMELMTITLKLSKI